MAYAIEHTNIGPYPFWYHLGGADSLDVAVDRARRCVLEQGGYVCVKDEAGKVVYGTDPTDLDRAISNGTNRDFPRETAHRAGYVG